MRDYVESSVPNDFLLPLQTGRQEPAGHHCVRAHALFCIAEAMYKHLRDNGVDVSIEHRDIQKNDVEEDARGEA